MAKKKLDEQYAIVFVDETYFSVKQDEIVVKKAVYIELGVTMTGEKEKYHRVYRKGYTNFTIYSVIFHLKRQ